MGGDWGLGLPAVTAVVAGEEVGGRLIGRTGLQFVISNLLFLTLATRIEVGHCHQVGFVGILLFHQCLVNDFSPPFWEQLLPWVARDFVREHFFVLKALQEARVMDVLVGMEIGVELPNFAEIGLLEPRRQPVAGNMALFAIINGLIENTNF